MTVKEPWRDGVIATDPRGFGNDRMGWSVKPFALWRRSVTDNWFQPLAFIGEKRGQLIPLVFAPAADGTPGKFTVTFRARRDGRLHLTVNDALGAWPWDAMCGPRVRAFALH